MRLLYIPLITNKNLNGCTSYNTGSKLIQQAVERNDDIFVHWYLPEVGGDSKWHYTAGPDPVEAHPRVMVHRVSMSTDQYMQGGQVPPDLFEKFSQIEGKFHVDVVLTERPKVAMLIRETLQHTFTRFAETGEGRYLGKTPPLPVVIRDPFVKSKELHVISEVEEIAQTMGYMTSRNIFFSQYDLDLALKVAKKYVNFAQVRKIREQSVVIAAGTDTEELDRIKEGTQKRDRFTLLIAERLKNGQLMDVLDAGDYVFKRGNDIDVVVSSQTAFNKKTVRAYPTLFEHAELHPENPRSKYLKLACEMHATVTMPSTHSYPQGLMERLYLGNVGILPDYPWVDSVLPNYPFKAPGRNVKSVVGMIYWVMENYEEACKRVAWVPQYIKEHYDTKIVTQQMLDFMRDAFEEAIAAGSPTRGYEEVVEQLEGGTITRDELLKFVKDNTIYKVEFNTPGQSAVFCNCAASLYAVMKRLGWTDTCEGPYPVFVRRT